ncbi:MAG: hypothetical protein AB8B55_04150 [Mariniblastus sp.]
MQDSELYQHILGLESPWKVSNLELGEIVVQVTHPKGTKFCCLECSKGSCFDRVAGVTSTVANSRRCWKPQFLELTIPNTESKRRQFPGRAPSVASH